MRLWLALIALPLSAHVLSMSTGEANVDGNRVDYIVRMPYYEVEGMAHPETMLLDQVRFAGGRLQREKCFRDRETYVCAGEYVFDRPVEKLDVTCTLYAVTVPNHVHSLRATRDGKEDRAIFDYTFTNAVLRFRPPTAMETALGKLSQGAMRGAVGFAQLLSALTMAMAARSRRELALVAGAFVVGMLSGVALNWRPAPRFAECSAAIGVAYLAVEILFVPDGGVRWLIAAALGACQGLYVKQFAFGGEPLFLAGEVASTLAVCAIGGLILLKRTPKWSAALPLAAGVAWFFLRLNG